MLGTQAPSIDAVLRERFRLEEFRPGQREVMGALLRGHGALAVFPTGGGKSLCYQLPALLLDGVTIVISPLIALMKDQIDALRRLDIPAARLDSSLSADEAAEVTRQLRRGELKLLYVAPERFINERFLELLRRIRIALFAIDEAHCISQWGHNFRPDYLKLADVARELGIRRILALTATATPAVIDDICASFDIPPEGAIVTGFYRPNLLLRVSPTPVQQRDAALRERLREQTSGGRIVYVTLQKTAERVANNLASAGIPARAYHAGMEDEQRHAVQEWWQSSPGAVVVATIAFGMGIDKADVRAVYHYNLPKGLESYSQEIGRAGRDGATAIVELLGGSEDLAALENFAYGDTPTSEALAGLLEEVAAAEGHFDVKLTALAARHDIRPLVLRTALTYLELAGMLRQGTPFYAGYKLRPLETPEEIAGRFSGERSTFIAGIFAKAKKGRIWYTLDPEEIAEQLGEERSRVISAVEYMGEQGWVEITASDARQRYHLTAAPEAILGFHAELERRFAEREEQEITRLRQVVALLTHAGCVTGELLRYFGEELDGPCGHCSFCETGRAATLPPPPQQPAIGSLVDPARVQALSAAAPQALGHPRQQARFLCGLTSPALSAAKLGGDQAFGILASHHFADVLAWCAEHARD